MFNICPMRIRFGSRLGLAESNELTLMEYWRAMDVAVSPAFTECVRMRLADPVNERLRSGALIVEGARLAEGLSVRLDALDPDDCTTGAE